MTPELLARHAETVRRSTMKRLDRFAPMHASFAPDEEAMRLADLAVHLVHSDRALMNAAFTGYMGPNLGARGLAGSDPHWALGTAIVELEETGIERAKWLRSMNPDALQSIVIGKRLRGRVEIPLASLVLELLDHEAHHRGQLTVYLRAMNLP